MRYQVSGFTIDTDCYRVLGTDGEVVPAEPKVFDLLVYLLRHRERVVTREELFQTVWEGREVSDATLSNHVMGARRLLGDSGEAQRAIQTVRGRGYQFVAPVREMPGETPDDVKPDSAGPFEASPRQRHPWRAAGMAVGLAIVLVIAALAGWRWYSADTPAAEVASQALRPYVVVVPFDVAPDAPREVRLFAAQLTRDVIGKLQKISGLQVLPRASAAALGNVKSREHIRAQVPQAHFLLDGQVIVAPDGTLRFTPELEDLSSGLLLFDDPYPFNIDNTTFFEMASGIAEAVSRALKVEILSQEKRALTRFPTSNPRAYYPYVAGWEELELLTPESLHRAIGLFEDAIELDPQFLAAYLARSDAKRMLFTYFEPPIRMLAEVQGSLADALKVRPDSAEALGSLGLTQVMAWQWSSAWENLSKAKAIDPSLALTELGLALYYTGLGESQGAREAAERANRLDPLNTELADWGLWALFMSGELKAARQWGEEKMRQHPANGLIACSAGITAYLSGDNSQGVRLLERCVELSNREPLALLMLAGGYGFDGQPEKVEPLIREARDSGGFACPYESAIAWVSIDQPERAISLLYEAVEVRSNCLMFLHVDPRLAPIRGDPRYADLLTKVGLDAASRARYER